MKEKCLKILEKTPQILKDVLTKLFSIEIIERDGLNSTEKLLNSMKTTSRCRFNASLRIKLISKVSFLTTTILSLGLILIPLLQNITEKQVFSKDTLSTVQIILAVFVLVYSTIVATAKYEVRSIELDRCGVELKNLIRDIRAINRKLTKDELKKFNDKYDEIMKDCENHERTDYIRAQLSLNEYFTISLIHKFYLHIKLRLINFLPYTAPITLILSEVIFLFDLVGITNILPNYLQ